MSNIALISAIIILSSFIAYERKCRIDIDKMLQEEFIELSSKVKKNKDILDYLIKDHNNESKNN